MPPIAKPAMTRPAIEARVSPSLLSISAMYGNMPNMKIASTNTAPKQYFASGLLKIVR